MDIIMKAVIDIFKLINHSSTKHKGKVVLRDRFGKIYFVKSGIITFISVPRFYYQNAILAISYEMIRGDRIGYAEGYITFLPIEDKNRDMVIQAINNYEKIGFSKRF